MKAVLDIFQGDSFTVAFAMPTNYDMSRLTSAKVYFGSTLYPHIIEGVGLNIIKATISSAATAALIYRQALSLTIDDTELGVKKIDAGFVNVLPINSPYYTIAESNVYSVVISVVVTDTALSTSAALYNVLRGKTAYESAVDGGYAGTEAQFDTLMATFPVTATATIEAAAAALESEQAAALSESNASGSAISAQEDAGLAEQAKLDAQTAQGLSEDARDKAEKWADETKNVPVEPDKYSAKHWAETAADTVDKGVSVLEQTFTDPEKAQARTNIAAQAITDPALTTTDKTVVGAVNELKAGSQTKAITPIEGMTAETVEEGLVELFENTSKSVFDEIVEVVETVVNKAITSTGTLVESVFYTAYDLFEINPLSRYYQTGRYVYAAGYLRLAFYDADGVFISGQTPLVSTTYAKELISGIPENARFMAICNVVSTSPPYILKVEVEEIQYVTIKENFESRIAELETNIVETNNNILALNVVDKTFIPFNHTLYSQMNGGSTINGRVVTLPAANTTNSYIGATTVSILANRLFLNVLTGKKVKFVALLKVTGDKTKHAPFNISCYFAAGTVNLSNRVQEYITDDICLASGEWTVIDPLPTSGQFYLTIKNTVAAVSDSFIELLDFGFLIEDLITEEFIQIDGVQKYVIEELIKHNVPSATGITTEFALPAIIPVAKGRDFNLYPNTLRNITDEQERIQPIIASGASGAMKNDRYNYFKAATEASGTVNLSLKEKSIIGSLLATKSTQIKDVEVANKLAATDVLNIIAIGDSISEGGWYELELRNLFKTAFDASGSDLFYFGTRANHAANYEVGMTNVHSLALPTYTECRGGWWTTNYLVAERAQGDGMDAPNPFWNATREGGADTDFVWYLSQINALPLYSGSPLSTIHVFSITLGSNDMVVISLQQFIDNIRLLMSKMWRDFPDCVILINTIPPTGLDFTRKALTATWNKRLVDEFSTPEASGSGTGRSYLIPLHVWVDRERGYGYPNTTRLIGQSSIATSGADSLHPYILGHLQIADAIFSGIQNAIELHNAYLDSL